MLDELLESRQRDHLAPRESNPTVMQVQRSFLNNLALRMHFPPEEIIPTSAQQSSSHDDDSERDRFVRLLMIHANKKKIREFPRDESECVRLLRQWLRYNTLPNGKDVKQRGIYRVLAVDGLDGFEAKHLKAYVSGLWYPDQRRPEYKRHDGAVRCMYDWIEANPDVSSLTGTDSACVVFLALLNCYRRGLPRLLMDDEIASQTKRARCWAEGFLHRDVSFYRDVRKVTDVLLDELCEVYADAFENWHDVGTEFLKSLCNKRLDGKMTPLVTRGGEREGQKKEVETVTLFL